MRLTPEIAPLAGAAFAFLVALTAEWLHTRRVRRVAPLAFGPAGRPRRWVAVVPVFRVLALTGMAWALLTLLVFKTAMLGTPPTEHRADAQPEHLVLVLDYSPSMTIPDAGPKGDQTRRDRLREVVGSVVDRMGKHVSYTVLCFYTRALPIAQKVFDREIVRNVLNDLPVEYALEPGKTDLGKAVNSALEFIQDYPRKSVTLMICTDGDTVETEALRPLPTSVKRAFVLGVGDIQQGTPMDDHPSRQDPIVLEALARHLNGSYLDVNARHLASTEIHSLCRAGDGAAVRTRSRGDVALLVLATLAFLYAVALPLALEFGGSDWRPQAAAQRGGVS